MRPARQSEVEARYAAWDNDFRSAAERATCGGESERELHALSLGLLPRDTVPDQGTAMEWMSRPFLATAWPDGLNGPLPDDRAAERVPRINVACMRIWQGRAKPGDQALVRRGLTDLPAWAPRIVMAMVLARSLTRQGRVSRAARVLVSAADGYDGFRRLRRSLKVPAQPPMLDDFEESCRHVLGRFRPPVKPGRHPVARLKQVVAEMPRRKRRPPALRTMRALDALVAAGRDAPSGELEGRVAVHLAEMLSARVLLHYTRGVYMTQEEQRSHTLSTWSVIRLARERRVVARRVKPAPEFWRPEQRRPGGVLSVPIGDGVACLARSRPFSRSEVRAVKTILRFLQLRRDGPAPEPATSPEPATPARDGTAPPIRGLVGQSKSWRRVLATVWRVAPADCSVLILGESGTGKEHVARGIHLASPRAHGPFVAMNCGAVHQGSLQSELFGHVRGAFTGATGTRQGRFREAHRGTLFLDEVGDMPTQMQVALLRVLEEKQVLPLGGTRVQQADVRIVCATNKNLEDEVRRGRFREDLLHRLDVVRLSLPPLRERGEDLLLLAHHLLKRAGADKTLTADAMDALAAHTWPGNVRELDNVLRASALLSQERQLGAGVIEHVIASRRIPRRRAGRSTTTLTPRAMHLLQVMDDEWWSAPRIAEAIGVSTRTVNRELAALEDHGRIQSLGEARARRYRVISERRDSS